MKPESLQSALQALGKKHDMFEEPCVDPTCDHHCCVYNYSKGKWCKVVYDEKDLYLLLLSAQLDAQKEMRKILVFFKTVVIICLALAGVGVFITIVSVLQLF